MNSNRVEPCRKCNRLLPLTHGYEMDFCPHCKASKPHADVERNYWADFEKRDRAAHPAKWAVHDHMMRARLPSPRWPRVSWTEAAILAVLTVLACFLFS